MTLRQVQLALVSDQADDEAALPVIPLSTRKSVSAKVPGVSNSALKEKNLRFLAITSNLHRYRLSLTLEFSFERSPINFFKDSFNGFSVTSSADLPTFFLQ